MLSEAGGRLTSNFNITDISDEEYNNVLTVLKLIQEELDVVFDGQDIMQYSDYMENLEDVLKKVYDRYNNLSNQTTLSLYEDSSGQLSMFDGIEEKQKEIEHSVEKTNESIEGQINLFDCIDEQSSKTKQPEFIQESSGQLSMFEGLEESQKEIEIAVEKTNNAIEGQISLVDYLNEKDTFDATSESSEMDKVATHTEEAVEAKKDFASANEGVQDSVDGSKSKLQLEAELMESIAKNARKAANAKKEFVEANKKVKESTDDSNSSLDDENNDGKKSKKSKKSSKEPSKEITDTISATIQEMQRLQYVGSGDTFTRIFEEANEKVKELNQQLAKDGNIDEYNIKIKHLFDNIRNGYTNKKNQTFKFIEPNDINAAEEAMRQHALSVSDNNAQLKKTVDISGDTIYTWTDQNKMVHTLKFSYDQLTGALGKAHTQQQKLEKPTKKLSDLFRQGWQNVKQYVLSFVGFYEIVNAVRNGITVIKELDTALTEMRKVSDESVQSLKKFQAASFDIASSVGTTAKQIQNSTADWMRLGESLEEASESAKVANILLNVSEFESIDQATESLVSMSAAYNELDKIDIVDKLNLIGNNFAISTDGLATALQNSASALRTAQNDIDESIALATAANAVVQDPDKVGAGLRTIALRITGTEAAKEELAELGEDVDDYVVTTASKLNEQVKSLTKTVGKDGISLLDDNGNYRSTYEILQDIADVWEQIAKEDLATGQNRQNALLEMLAGKNRSNILASILQSPETLRAAYESSVNDSAGSAQEELEKYLDSIEGKIAQFQNEVQEFWYNLISSETVKDIVDFGIKVMDVLGNIVGKLNEVETIFLGLGAVFGIKGLINNSGGRDKKFSLVIKYATESFSLEVCEF